MAKPKITIKEAKLIKGIAEGKTQRQAYIDAYDTKGSLPTVDAEASKTIRKPQVQEALAIALEQHGITLDTAIAPIGKALTAMKQNEFTGEITEDIQTQLKGSDRALKLMGIGQDKEGSNIHYHLHQAEQRLKYDL